ncbi:cyclin cyclin A [Cryptosporidium sp. chipmunk genotype I]|uniref:cyclin cyclin A n=1 Tax=Cryptosporidium sp. chipmunk genotype I TaxID=1280935 RepID=UPI00351A7AEB|nr:cyclin cyclin A [Cryptosporidium sp. chipmunk genotype I]
MKKSTIIKKVKGVRNKKETEFPTAESKQKLLSERDETYFSAMRLVEENVWTKWGLLKLDPETKELQITMFKVLNELGLMYQVKFVSIYLMFLMRNSWDQVLLNAGKSFANKSHSYKNNLLMVSCIFISSNYEELDPPSYSSIVQAVHNSGFQMKSGEKMIRKQVHILERLAWELTGFQVELPSANSFLMQIIQNSTLPKSKKFRVSKLSTEIIHSSLSSQAVIKYKQSLIATSSISLAIAVEYEKQPEKKQIYVDEVLSYSGYSSKQVQVVQKILGNVVSARK